MTEQEAQAFRERLERIWKPEKVVFFEGDEQMGYAWCADVTARLRVEVDCGRDVVGHDLIRIEMFPEHDVVSLHFDSVDGLCASVRTIVLDRARAEQRSHQFAVVWLPVFRRGCWLSGCDIEATAHEKVEWMREFTKEEIESWQLKM